MVRNFIFTKAHNIPSRYLRNAALLWNIVLWIKLKQPVGHKQTGPGLRSKSWCYPYSLALYPFLAPLSSPLLCLSEIFPKVSYIILSFSWGVGSRCRMWILMNWKKSWDYLSDSFQVKLENGGKLSSEAQPIEAQLQESPTQINWTNESWGQRGGWLSRWVLKTDLSAFRSQHPPLIQKALLPSNPLNKLISQDPVR